MLINVAKIRKVFGAAENFTLRERLGAIDFAGGSLGFTEPLLVDLKATNIGHSILLQGKVTTKASLACSRCLEQFSYQVDTVFQEEMCHSGDISSYLADNPEAQEDENFTVYSGDELELTPLMLEHVLLSLPMKPLCNEECRGLCPKCGRNLNREICNCELDPVDPRLAGLARFLKQED